MIYLFSDAVSYKASIIVDESSLTDELKAKGVAVESLPVAEEVEGRVPVLCCDCETKEVWYEYEIAPVDTPTEIENLKQLVADLTELVLMGGTA